MQIKWALKRFPRAPANGQRPNFTLGKQLFPSNFPFRIITFFHFSFFLLSTNITSAPKHSTSHHAHLCHSVLSYHNSSLPSRTTSCLCFITPSSIRSPGEGKPAFHRRRYLTCCRDWFVVFMWTMWSSCFSNICLLLLLLLPLYVASLQATVLKNVAVFFTPAGMCIKHHRKKGKLWLNLVSFLWKKWSATREAQLHGYRSRTESWFF